MQWTEKYTKSWIVRHIFTLVWTFHALVSAYTARHESSVPYKLQLSSILSRNMDACSMQVRCGLLLATHGGVSSQKYVWIWININNVDISVFRSRTFCWKLLPVRRVVSCTAFMWCTKLDVSCWQQPCVKWDDRRKLKNNKKLLNNKY